MNKYICQICGADLSKKYSVVREYYWGGSDQDGVPDVVTCCRGHFDLCYFEPDETPHLPSSAQLQLDDDSDHCMCCDSLVYPETAREEAELRSIPVSDLPLYINRKWSCEALHKAYLKRIKKATCEV